MIRRGCAPLAAAAAVFAGCATPPAEPVATPATIAAPPQVEVLEHAYRQRAVAFGAERRWADAAVQWELLMALRPGSQEYRREAEAARRRGADAAAAHVQAAAQARKRGNDEQAVLFYLRALSVDPANATAAAGLKAIELERTRRAWLSRSPRIPYAPPGTRAAPPTPYDPSAD